MPSIQFFAWSDYSTDIPATNIINDTRADVNFIGHSITFNGGAPITLDLSDDDKMFEDGYVETGAPQLTTQDITIGGVTYPASTVVQNEFSMLDANGNEYFVVRLGNDNVGVGYPIGQSPQPGETFSVVGGRDGLGADSTDGQPSLEPYRNLICFCAGTMIRVPGGECAVEDLAPGHLVETLDHGVQPLRWVGHRRVQAIGRFAPVRLAPGRFGNTRALSVSPQHRILIDGWQAELHFGRPKVLVPAIALVNGDDATVLEGGWVDYYHLLFDRHEIVWSNDVPTESFHPGAIGLSSIPQAQLDEILALFGALQNDPDAYGPAAYPSVRVSEGRVIAP